MSAEWSQPRYDAEPSRSSHPWGIAGVGGAAPGTFCKGDAALRLIEAGARFLYTSYDAWLEESGRAWLAGVRGVEGRE